MTGMTSRVTVTSGQGLNPANFTAFSRDFLNVIWITFLALNPSYVRSIKPPSGVTARTTTMTSFHRLTALKAITLGAALSMTAGFAYAGDNNVSSDQIISALQPKPLTRGLSVGPQADPAARAKEIDFVQTLRNRKTRSLSMGEREEIADIASTKPNIDLDIRFDYNSADISTASMPSVQALGKAWDDPAAWEGIGNVPDSDLSNTTWGKITLTELVVHGWDIATATGQPFDLPEQTLQACFDHVAVFVPNAPLPDLWGPPAEVPPDASLLDRIVAITGRVP